MRSRRVATLAMAMGLALAGPAVRQPAADPLPGPAPPAEAVRPLGMMAQLEHCHALATASAPVDVLERCFRHARQRLAEGLRRRGSPDAGQTSFESRLQAGGRELAARIEALPLRDPERLREALGHLDAFTRALRAELSRISAADHVELSLVSRGGVSLGSWQAGFLYVVTEWAKQRPGLRRDATYSEAAFSTVTGASAGAVNGFAAAIEGCKRPNPVASESLYYRFWIELGLFGRHGRSGLFPNDEDGATALSLFSNRALEQALDETLDHVAAGGALPGCRLDFGFVATHLDRTGSPVHVAPDGTPILSTQKLKEKFTLRLHFPSASGEPGVENLGPPPAFAGDRIYYAGLGHEQRVPLRSLMLGVRASGAFPAAFPPVPLTYTRHVPGPDGGVLPRKEVATFIDGGVLDNTPVGLAVAIDAWREPARGADPLLEGLLPPEPRTYVFLEPGVTSWVRGRRGEAESATRSKDVLRTYLDFAGDLLATTMDAQLTNTAEQLPFVRRDREDWTQPRLSVPERHMPIAGEQFGHFMAFLERDFRIFDFHVGMADAFAYLEREQCRYAPHGDDCDPDRGGLQRLDGALRQHNPLYRCIRDYYESDQFVLLEPIETRQLPEACRELAPVECTGKPWRVSARSVESFLESRSITRAGEEDACIEPSIANHNFRALLAGMHNYKVWTQSDEYAADGEFDHFFQELSRDRTSERFVYVDLPSFQESNDGFLDSKEAKQAFRSLMQEGLDRIASQQKGFSKYALRLGGRAAADLAYERDYPARILGVGIVLNGIEGVFGQRLGRSRFRIDTTFRYFRIQQQTYGLGLRPFTSELYLSAQATWILSPTRFADLEIGGGWALSELIAYNGPSPGHIALRTGPRSFAALVILQRVYVGVNVDYYPLRAVEAAYQNAINPVATDWQFNVAGGWRFLF